MTNEMSFIKINSFSYRYIILSWIVILAFMQNFNSQYLKIFIVIYLLAFLFETEQFKAPLKFIYACFLKPIGNHADQRSRLDSFYKDQAEVYDATRGRLLRGRLTMLRLTAGQLRKQMDDTSRKPIWVDIGGGTGKYTSVRVNDWLSCAIRSIIYPTRT